MRLSYSVASALLHVASLLVPEAGRAEWFSEWSAELWYSLRDGPGTLRFCLGAFPDALWIVRNSEKRVSPVRLASPKACLGWLAALTAAALFAVARSHARSELLLPQLFVIAVAFFLLPIATSLSLGEYPSGHQSRAFRFRRWLFLLSKFALVIPLVFCAVTASSWILSAHGLQPDATLVGYVLGFRWVLLDQRRRCPVCLRRVTSPAQIGQPAHNFLEWCGTEFACPRGHGLLYVPRVQTTSVGVQRWTYLDPSWRSLF